MLQKEVAVSDSMVKTVSRFLKEARGAGTEILKMTAIQALVEVLNREGHYCKLILGSAASVRKQAILLAESRYNGIMRRKSNCQPFRPFNPETVDVAAFPEQVR
eukprot:6214027-Pleurochrysis_carterae.AAC.3